MPTRELLSESRRARFKALPEMDTRELARHHTLSDADLTAVGGRRGAANRLGFAVQLCLLRYPGRSLRAGEAVPRSIVEFVASQVGGDPDAFPDYAGGTGDGAGRDTTRREHAAEIVRTLGFRAFDVAAYRELSRWLLPIAEGTDSGEALVGALQGEMRERRIVAPALSTGSDSPGRRGAGRRRRSAAGSWPAPASSPSFGTTGRNYAPAIAAPRAIGFGNTVLRVRHSDHDEGN